MKDIRPSGSPFPAVHYWQPERTGDFKEDYQRGQQHFIEAVAVSFRPAAPLFLAHVLVAMFGNIGAVEHGFVDAMVDAAQFGRAAPKLTDEEVASIEADPADQIRLRRIENEMAEAIGAKGWLPDLMLVTALHHLSGAEGEFIGGSMTMIARTALNGKRN